MSLKWMIVSGLLVAAPVFGQWADPYYQRNAYNTSAPPRRDGLFARVQQDLDRAAASPYLNGGTRGHIDHARKEIWEFQKRWAGGRFDRGDLDGAIGAVKKVVNSASLDYRDRQTLAEDLGRMREFRAGAQYRGY